MTQYLPYAAAYLPAILCGIHAVRTGQNQYWLWILLVGGPAASIIYLVAVFLPSSRLSGKNTFERLLHLVDPRRTYRKARAEAEDVPTVHNKHKWAQAAEDLGLLEEAEKLIRECAVGHYKDDITLLTMHSRLLVSLEKYDEAIACIDVIRQHRSLAELPQVLLNYARALEGSGQLDKANELYHQASARTHGFEAIARRASLLAKMGNAPQAQELIADLDKRRKKVFRGMKAEANEWFQFARRAVEG